jgi:hypothetical protein
MIVGVCRLALFLPASHSLKDKRQVLRRLIDRTRQKFDVAIAETGDNDLWQRAEVGFAAVGNDRAHVDSVLHNVLSFVDSLYLGEILDRQIELFPFGEEEG